MIDIGLRIRDLREKSRLSIRQLGFNTGISASFLGDVERGKSSLSFDKINIICDYFGITLQDFLNEDNKHNYVILTPEQRKLLDSVKEFSPEKLSKLTELIELLSNN